VGEGAKRVTMVSLISMDDTLAQLQRAYRAACEVLAARDAPLGRQPDPCSIEMAQVIKGFAGRWSWRVRADLAHRRCFDNRIDAA